MLTAITFKWKKPGYRSSFGPEQVNISRRSFARNYPEPHRYICVTDDARGLDPDIEVVPLWNDHAELLNPTWPNGPSCYRRLKVFSRDFAKIAGDRLLHIDLDMVFTGDLRPLLDRPEDFVIWGTGNNRIPYCASMFLLRTGSMPHLWDDFDPKASPRITNQAGFKGSDQAWINYRLGRDIPTWTARDGVYAYRDEIVKLHKGGLPANSKVVVFCGKPDPWEHVAQNSSPWIRKHYF